MECAVCNVKVNDFKLQNFKGVPGGDAASAASTLPFERLSPVMDVNEERLAYMQSNPFLPSVLEDGFDEFIDRAQGASTPVGGARASPRSGSATEERVVLRIDNVPWVSVLRVLRCTCLKLTFSVGHHPSCYRCLVEAPR